mgnify:FL=1
MNDTSDDIFIVPDQKQERRRYILHIHTYHAHDVGPPMRKLGVYECLCFDNDVQSLCPNCPLETYSKFDEDGVRQRWPILMIVIQRNRDALRRFMDIVRENGLGPFVLKLKMNI